MLLGPVCSQWTHALPGAAEYLIGPLIVTLYQKERMKKSEWIIKPARIHAHKVH